MRIAIRVDASLNIGSGHVMRCLTLANALRERGVDSHFICRAHPGNLFDLIESKGFDVTQLPAGAPEFKPTLTTGAPPTTHATWLGVGWEADAEDTHKAMGSTRPDWLIVDHYALGRRWEQSLRSHCDRMMVIDDLADREHDCDLLLDQNLGRNSLDYEALVPATCTVFTGPGYALLRPEFAALRDYSLARRKSPQLWNILITMGGMDPSNATGQVLEAIKQSSLSSQCRIIVVMGPLAPWLKEIRIQAQSMAQACEVRVAVDNMAELMADSDLAIGAGGGTAWERCTLGLPALTLVLASNQREATTAIRESGATDVIEDVASIATVLPRQLENMNTLQLSRMSKSASAICDGRGVDRLLDSLHLKNLQIRPMLENDVSLVLRWRNHPNVRRFMYTQHEISESEHRAWYRQMVTNDRNHLLIAEVRGAQIGFVKFVEDNDGTATWGFYTAPGAPRGSGRRLGKIALDYAFKQLGLKTIRGEVIASNERSLALHRKLGFHEEDIKRGNLIDGVPFTDVLCFSLQATDWNDQKK